MEPAGIEPATSCLQSPMLIHDTYSRGAISQSVQPNVDPAPPWIFRENAVCAIGALGATRT